MVSRPHRDKTHVDWVKAYVSIWTELQNYIKQHHTTGLSWSRTVSLREGWGVRSDLDHQACRLGPGGVPSCILANELLL